MNEVMEHEFWPVLTHPCDSIYTSSLFLPLVEDWLLESSCPKLTPQV